ncbi:hypothetical protein DMUE_0053 [Dictyocoela muelleri]|nr:hypothetical protein DMUE_0053 [Dictyocoela muelleri]
MYFFIPLILSTFKSGTSSKSTKIEIQKTSPPLCLKKCESKKCEFDLSDPFFEGKHTLRCEKERCHKYKCNHCVERCDNNCRYEKCCDKYDDSDNCLSINGELSFMSPRHSCRQFLRCLKRYLFCNYGFQWFPECNRVFSFMFKVFENRYDEMIMCLSYMIHGTSGFTNMVGGFGCDKSDDDKSDRDYRSRGFLQITTLKNYRIASHGCFNYVDCPWKIADITVESMKAALKVYHYYLKCYYERFKCRSLKFSDVVYALRPCDTEEWAKNDAWFERIYCCRLNVYRDVCDKFDARYLPGKRRFHD